MNKMLWKMLKCGGGGRPVDGLKTTPLGHRVCPVCRRVFSETVRGTLPAHQRKISQR